MTRLPARVAFAFVVLYYGMVSLCRQRLFLYLPRAPLRWRLCRIAVSHARCAFLIWRSSPFWFLPPTPAVRAGAFTSFPACPEPISFCLPLICTFLPTSYSVYGLLLWRWIYLSPTNGFIFCTAFLSYIPFPMFILTARIYRHSSYLNWFFGLLAVLICLVVIKRPARRASLTAWRIASYRLCLRATITASTSGYSVLLPTNAMWPARHPFSFCYHSSYFDGLSHVRLFSVRAVPRKTQLLYRSCTATWQSLVYAGARYCSICVPRFALGICVKQHDGCWVVCQRGRAHATILRAVMHGRAGVPPAWRVAYGIPRFFTLADFRLLCATYGRFALTTACPSRILAYVP